MNGIPINRVAMEAVLFLAVLIVPSFSAGQHRVARGGIGAVRAGVWQNIGNAFVDGRADRDTIQVRGGPFSALALGVNGGAVRFHQMVIHFRNGETQVLPVATVVHSGQRTQPLPVRGGERQISKVELWYEKGADNQGKPRVDLFGRR